MINNFELKIIKKKEAHFLNDWNKITTYETSRLFFVLFLCTFIVLPIILYLLVLFCTLGYFVSYLVFRNYESDGVIKFSDKTIIIKTSDIDQEINFSMVDNFILTHKTWKNRIMNKNKQSEYNWIYIRVDQINFKLNYVFVNNSNFYDCLDFLEAKSNEFNSIKVFNLAKIGLDDLIR